MRSVESGSAVRVGARIARLAATVLGRLLAVPLGSIARWRHGKPMHPRGEVHAAVLERIGSVPPWGVPWLDERATERVVVRLSRGIGLPPPWPDLLGLAVRIPADGAAAEVDLLLSTSGRGPRTRRLPVLRRDVATSYGSLMGYRTDAGTLLLSAVGEHTAGGDRAEPVFVLAAARDGGEWRPFGRLTLAARAGDPDVRFDGVRRPPPGMVPDGPLAALRAPAYAAAQGARRRR